MRYEMKPARHAYMIMAHNEFELLEKLILFLDDERNDIYLHVDKKVKKFDFDKFKKLPTKSKICFVKRHNVHWAAYSQIATEMELFKAASEGNYSRYHLISGVDLPIKSIDYIYSESEKAKDYEFVDFASVDFIEKYPRDDRFKYYHFLEEIDVRKRGIGRIDKILLAIQQRVGVDRWKHQFEYGFGSQWVSLTDDAIKYILQQEKWINKTFRNTHCSDELFVQTTLLKGNFKFSDNRRFILWPENDASPHPKLLTYEDYDEISDSIDFFARKVSTKQSSLLIDKTYEKIKFREVTN